MKSTYLSVIDLSVIDLSAMDLSAMDCVFAFFKKVVYLYLIRGWNTSLTGLPAEGSEPGPVPHLLGDVVVRRDIGTVCDLAAWDPGRFWMTTAVYRPTLLSYDRAARGALVTDQRAVIAGSARTPLPGASRVGDAYIVDSDNGGYRADKGWDACTGLGTLIGERIVQALGSA